MVAPPERIFPCVYSIEKDSVFILLGGEYILDEITGEAGIPLEHI
jgi:hypothetical protein